MDDWTLTRKDKQEATTQPSSQDHWHFEALLDLFLEVLSETLHNLHKPLKSYRRAFQLVLTNTAIVLQVPACGTPFSPSAW